MKFLYKENVIDFFYNPGFGQVLMNRDRFVEDYPSIADEREIRALLLGEDSDIDPTEIKDSFVKRNWIL